MMLCGRCHSKNPNFSLYCEQCGAQLSEERSLSKKTDSFQRMPVLHQKESAAELKKYILDCMASGHAISQIKRALQREGYTEQEIQQAFVQAHQMIATESPHPKMEHHPLSSNPPVASFASNDSAKHAAMLFIALIAIVVVGGSIMFNAQNQIGAAVATQQQSDLIGQAVRILGEKETSLQDQFSYDQGQLIQMVQEVEQKLQEITEQKDQEDSTAGETFGFYGEKNKIEPQSSEILEQKNVPLTQEVPESDSPYILKTTKDKEFMTDVYGRYEEQDKMGQIMFTGGHYTKPSVLEGSTERSVAHSYDRVRTPGEVVVKDNVEAGMAGSVYYLEHTATLPSDFPKGIYLQEVRYKPTMIGDKIFLRLDEVTLSLFFQQHERYRVWVELLKEKNDLAPLWSGIIQYGDSLAGGNTFTWKPGKNSKDSVSERLVLRPDDEFVLAIYVTDETIGAQGLSRPAEGQLIFEPKFYKLITDVPAPILEKVQKGETTQLS
ncbi:hypothetical protein J4410_01120 [Candidatus Woesearchaeota archaeon]|nr:hypothetical protein [Candidatus Woesearchaeota archaeon]